MVTMAQETWASRGESVFVSRAGRRFPRNDSFGKPTAEAPPVELADSTEERELAEQLGAHLWPRLALSRLETGEDTSKGTVVELYTASLTELQRLQEDVRRLRRAICVASLDFRQQTGPTQEEAKRRVMERTLDEMVGRTEPSGKRPIKNVLTAELIAQSTPEQLLVRLRRALQDALSDFAKGFQSTLETLVDQQICGLIEWTGSQTCRYHFFRRVVLQSHHGTTTRRGPAQRDVNSSTGWSQTVTESEHGEHVIRRERHEHHVMHAFHTSMANTKVLMPDWARRLLGSIPDWVKPFVRIVDGDLVRQLIFGQDVKKETWEKTRVRNESAAVRDEPVFGWEPAIIIGGFVLGGWGPREVDAVRSQRREGRRDAQRHRFGRESLAWVWAAVFCFVLAIGCALTATGGGVNWGYVAMLLLASGFYATVCGSYCHERVMQARTRWPFVMLVGALISLVPTVICAAIVAIR